MYSDKGSGVVIKEGAVITSKESEKLETAFYLREWDHLSIVETARKLVSKGIGTIIVDKAGTDVGNIDLDAVLRSAEENDELAMDLVKRSALALGVRAAYLMNVFGIRVMILGGGLQKIEGNYAGFLSESVKRFTLKEIAEKLDIKPGELADKADSIGAAALCRRESFTEVKI
jgi:predicted NBD/HSP70 family sugar kinase